VHKKTFESIVLVVVMVVTLPVAWHIHHTYSLGLQGLSVGILMVFAYAFRKLVYEPIKAKLPD
jgi:multisubunit Na+/H+ antiporter MnhB subunit